MLIGGSSQLTIVRQMLTELLPDTTIDTCGEKDVAVALGNIAEEQIIIDPPRHHENDRTEKCLQNKKIGLEYLHDDDGKLSFNW